MTPNPPTPHKSDEKTQKPRRHRRNALQRFLAMSATIRRNYAPDFDGANPQGVQWDSLESFISIGARKGGETPALRAFLRAQRRQLYYMYCSHIIYIIYFISLQYVCVMWKIVVQCGGMQNREN